MIQVIVQGLINSEIKNTEIDNLKHRSTIVFSIKCMNSLQTDVNLLCFAYNSFGQKIFNEYKKGDIVTIFATLISIKEQIALCVFSIEPSNISVIPHKRMLYEDEYVTGVREYSIEDVRELLNLK